MQQIKRRPFPGIFSPIRWNKHKPTPEEAKFTADYIEDFKKLISDYAEYVCAPLSDTDKKYIDKQLAGVKIAFIAPHKKKRGLCGFTNRSKVICIVSRSETINDKDIKDLKYTLNHELLHAIDYSGLHPDYWYQGGFIDEPRTNTVGKNILLFQKPNMAKAHLSRETCTHHITDEIADKSMKLCKITERDLFKSYLPHKSKKIKTWVNKLSTVEVEDNKTMGLEE
jgi:hypothetical protein